MGLGKLIAVIDAGPLIHLAEIDGLRGPSYAPFSNAGQLLQNWRSGRN